MVFEKKNSANNADCGLEFWFNETALIIFAIWNYDRFPTSNFIWEVTTFDPTQDNKVIARENIFFTSRAWNQFNVWVLANRAYEPVPIDDDQDSNIQQALPFSATNTVIKVVWSAKPYSDLQDEIIRLENEKLNISDYIEWKKVFNASSVATDDYNITVVWLSGYVNGAIYRVQADVANTGPATLEINSFGAKDLKKSQWTEVLADDDIKANGIFSVVYNATLDVFQYSSQLANPVSADDITWVIKQFAWASAPSWYFICDWQAVDRTTYADLFAIVWTLYWVWNWSTTFNIPNLLGRVPVGKNSGTFSTLWGTWWSESHTLTEAEMPAHTHTLTVTNTTSWAWVLYWQDGISNSPIDYPTSSKWSSNSHNNLQPYLVLNHIIKF